MQHSRLLSADALFLCSLLPGCGADGPGPSEDAALHDRLVVEAGSGIGIMAPDGNQRRSLAIGSDLEQALSPAVSPDGRRIVFTGLKTGQLDLYVMNADGSGRRQLTNDLAQELDPAWSPDGNSLLFSWTGTAPSSPTMLAVIGADGSGRRELLLDGWGGRVVSGRSPGRVYRGRKPGPGGISNGRGWKQCDQPARAMRLGVPRRRPTMVP
ncbi:MAG: hypothetical protein ABI037_12260 [Gemmatimonadales bacterium]